MIDLTKILKVGDEVFCAYRGAGEVVYISEEETYPLQIRFDAGLKFYTAQGRNEHGQHPTLYPSHQAVPVPEWPEVIEWNGEVYQKGEWVAVSDSDPNGWQVAKLDSVISENTSPIHKRYRIRCIAVYDETNHDDWDLMRKLSSFNKE